MPIFQVEVDADTIVANSNCYSVVFFYSPASTKPAWLNIKIVMKVWVNGPRGLQKLQKLQELHVFCDEGPCEAQHVSSLNCNWNLLEEVGSFFHFSGGFGDSSA